MGADGFMIPKQRGGLSNEAITWFKWMATEGETEWATTQAIHTNRRGARTQWPDYTPLGAYETWTEAMETARPTPGVPVVQLMMDRLGAETDKAFRKQITATAALREVQNEVQRELDRILR